MIRIDLLKPEVLPNKDYEVIPPELVELMWTE
jgi:hypothetical protein